MDSTGVLWYDYLIFGAILAISLAIGIVISCLGGKQKTTKEYVLANRQLGKLNFHPKGITVH